MRVTITRAAVAAVLSVFCLGVGLPAASVAQDKPPTAMSEKPIAKKAMKAAKKGKAAKKKAPSRTVAALQKALNGKGAMLKVDGYMGRETRAALKKYQAANNLKATGRLDKASRAKLGI